MLPLATKLQKAMVFSHAMSDEALFTELAVVNPGAGEALATVDPHGADGSREATATVKRAGQGRKVMTPADLFPALAGKAHRTGYTRLAVDRPVAAYLLCGTKERTSLRSIPAQVVP